MQTIASYGQTEVTMLDAFGNRESFDLYICPKCGKVKFFMEG